VLCPDWCSYLERPKVTANVVDIESVGQTVLHAADVSELGEGTVEVIAQSTTMALGVFTDQHVTRLRDEVSELVLSGAQ